MIEYNISHSLPHASPLLGTGSATQACDLDQEFNWQPPGHVKIPTQLSHPGQGSLFSLKYIILHAVAQTRNLGIIFDSYLIFSPQAIVSYIL